MPGNAPNTRAVVTTVLVIIWGLLMLGFEYSEGVVSFTPEPGMVLIIALTAIVFAIVGQMWRLERLDAVYAFLGVAPGQEQDGGADPEDYLNERELREETEDFPDD